MENRKFSYGPGNDAMVLIFLWQYLAHDTNFLAKNEQNLPLGFRDRPPLATA